MDNWCIVGGFIVDKNNFNPQNLNYRLGFAGLYNLYIGFFNFIFALLTQPYSQLFRFLISVISGFYTNSTTPTITTMFIFSYFNIYYKKEF